MATYSNTQWTGNFVKAKEFILGHKLHISEKNPSLQVGDVMAWAMKDHTWKDCKEWLTEDVVFWEYTVFQLDKDGNPCREIVGYQAGKKPAVLEEGTETIAAELGWS